MSEPIELEVLLPEVLRLRMVQPPAELPADFAAALVGKPGPAGGATYTHSQTVPSSIWTVAHNLGRKPSVTVTDHLGNVVVPDVRYLDNDLVQVTHGVSLTGYVYCN